MTQQPFSRPGAFDLSSLKRPEPPAGGPAGPGAQGAPAGGQAAAGSSYAVEVTEANFQQVLEMSMTAPVLLAFYSRTRLPESGTLADDLAEVVGELEGRFLAGLVDIDAQPAIAQAVQLQSIPMVFAVIEGRPAPVMQDVLPKDELRTALTQIGQQLTTQGVAGRHQPLQAAPPAGAEVADEPAVDPRYAPAEDALDRGDVDAAVAEYQKLVDANPADAEAAAGLAMSSVLQRSLGVDPDATRAAADAAPDDLAAQSLAADLDLVDGRPEDAFARLVELVRRSAGKERDAAREHLLTLFAAVGSADPRVVQGRRDLASALY